MRSNYKKISLSDLSYNWKGSALREESSLHQISPYLGKMKSSMANALISLFSQEGDYIYDPFSGSGTVSLESWINNRNIIANDLNPYAFLLTKAKLFPYSSIDKAFNEINKFEKTISKAIKTVDLRRVPKWVRSFFHPETLREVITWVQILRANRSHFLLACLLGILHHQRPGFLSYPSSHTVPYRRENKFPREYFPELYQYRPVKERLEKKVMRALKRVPTLNSDTIRQCRKADAARFSPLLKVNTIITSPPYMRKLDYGRDNRLRLWFLGLRDWKSLDYTISPSEIKFLTLFKICLRKWLEILSPKGICVFVLGDTYSKFFNLPLPDVVSHIATKEIGGYSEICKYTETIPNERRVRRGCKGNLTETVLVLSKSS